MAPPPTVAWLSITCEWFNYPAAKSAGFFY
jgi:hypothetical protein